MSQADNGDLKGRAVDLAGLIDFQSGSVVSRTLIDKKVGTISLFAFDEGQGLSEHTAPYDAFVYVYDGEGVVTIEGAPHRLTEGAMIIMPAGKPHEVRATKKFKMMLVMIRS